MIATATLREHFGLSQPQLADLLNISVSLIKMIESGHRRLLGEAMEKYLELGNLATKQGTEALTPKVMQNKEDSIATIALNKYIQKISEQLRRQEQELLEMKSKYQQALNRQVLIQALSKKKGLHKAPISESILSALAYKTEEDLLNNGIKKQTLLNLKIDINNYSLKKALKIEQVWNE